MKYVGSKNKLSKELIPIIQSFITKETESYIEPFVGGANIIDKIQFHKKIGYDIHSELIELLNYVKYNSDKLPIGISKDEYVQVRDNKDAYDKWFVGLVGFCGSYNAKYFGGYAGECITKQGIRHYDQEAIRNLKKQAKNLKDIEFKSLDFRKLDTNNIKNSTIYCDIPYRDTTDYKTEKFPYEEFYEWCKLLSKNNTVLISEYNMPDDIFECMWEKEHRTFLDKNDNNKKRIEKLFTVKDLYL